MTSVAIVDSGVANLASIVHAFHFLGADPVVTRNPATVRSAQFAVLPGVGAFTHGMQALRTCGTDLAILDRVTEGKPVLAVCLGFQLLCDSSEEAPDIPGLGIVHAPCRRIEGGVNVPHLGWNAVRPAVPMRWVGPGQAAFAHSYGVTQAPAGWSAAYTVHGTRITAALERDRTLACQFHPELSGAYGLGILRRWLDNASGGTPAGAAVGGHSRRIIPCLDVKDGRVVKGVRFQRLRDVGDPAAHAARYEAQGADEIVLLDIAASPEAKDTRIDTVRGVRAHLHIPLTVGGGVRSVVDAERLLSAGADKISVNTAAVANPDLVSALARRFGSQCIVLAIDARRWGQSWEVIVAGGRRPGGRNAIEWAQEGAALGAGEILLTSWDRDGTLDGCDAALVTAVSAPIAIPVIASGGVGSVDHVADAIGAGADAVLAASLFHDDRLNIGDLKRDLAARGVAVRS